MSVFGNILCVAVAVMALACLGLCVLAAFRRGRAEGGRWCCRPGTGGPGDLTGR